MTAKDLYEQIEASGIRVEYREPDWTLTRIADGKDLTLADLSPEQYKILGAIQRGEYWPDAGTNPPGWRSIDV